MLVQSLGINEEQGTRGEHRGELDVVGAEPQSGHVLTALEVLPETITTGAENLMRSSSRICWVPPPDSARAAESHRNMRVGQRSQSSTGILFQVWSVGRLGQHGAGDRSGTRG